MIRRKAKGCLTAIAVFLGICFVVGIFSNDEDKSQNINNFSSNQEVFTTEVDEITTKIFIAEEITTEVYITEEPTTEVPITEEPTTEVPITEEPTTEVPITEEPTTEVPITEEPTTEVPITEEPTTEVPITEEPTTEVLTTEDHSRHNEYDDLQEIFSEMSLNMEISDINDLKAGKNVILHANVSKNGDKLEYCLAYDPHVASGKRGASGDCIELSFSSIDGSFMFARYTKSHEYSILLYNYGIYYEFREYTPNNRYSGCYCFDIPETEDFKIEYDNGNSTTISCVRCSSAEDALILANAQQ